MAGIIHWGRNGREWFHTTHRFKSALRLTLLNYSAGGLCAVCHHSRPFLRQRTIPAVLDLSILFSSRSVSKILCQKSRLRSHVSSRDLGTGDCIEIVPAHRSSQSRLPTPLPSSGAWRVNNEDIHNAWDRPHSTTWSRTVAYGAWGHIRSAAHACSCCSITLRAACAPYGTVLDHIVE